MDIAKLNHQVTSAIFEGRKLEAVKQVKETLGIGLKEALEYVEALERGEVPDAIGFPAEENYHVSMDKETEEVIRLLQKGKKIEAVKYIRQTRKLGLKESADYVEMIEVKHGLNDDANLSETASDSKTRLAIALLVAGIAASIMLWLFLLAD